MYETMCVIFIRSFISDGGPRFQAYGTFYKAQCTLVGFLFEPCYGDATVQRGDEIAEFNAIFFFSDWVRLHLHKSCLGFSCLVWKMVTKMSR